jgi:3-hydroxyisobutyrate dehydrogenase
MKVGVCGIGRMGAALAERLIELGHEVQVWNRTASRCDPLVAQGVKQAASPAELAEACEATFVIVMDAVAQETVYGGDQGIGHAALGGNLVIDMSTVAPDAARKAGAYVVRAGGAYLECPVGGTVTPARTGKLLGLAGGDAATFERAKPLLETLCRRVEHVGAIGCGAAMKLAINLPLAVYWEALGEALSIAAAGGVPKELAADLMSDSSGAISVMKPRVAMILGAIDDAEPTDPAFDISGMAKDLSVMQATAEGLGFKVPVAAAAKGAYEDAKASGWSGRDAATQAAWRFTASVTKE